MKKIIFFIYCSLIITSINAQTQVTFYTTKGDFVVEMEDVLAPITSTNFIDLVNQEFYDGIIFHRVINNFMIQGGDPTGTGSGGSGVTIPDEFHVSLSNIKKTISMANSGPNTGTSQFFINTVNNTFLDFDKAPLTSKHPVFGKVISGWNTVEDIETVTVNGSNKPLVDVVMDSVRIRDFPLSDNAISKSNKVQIKNYPNPSSGQFNIDFKEKDLRTIVLLDATGKKVFTTVNNTTEFQLDVTNYPKGIYFIKVTGSNSNYIEKMVLK